MSPSKSREAIDGRDTETLADRVYRQVKNSIKAGSFAPGQKLTVRAIASALNVSATPVREALSRLVTESALEMAGPKTMIVPRLSLEKYDEIISMRLALEGLAAEKAVEHASSEFIDELEQTHLAFVAARSNGDYPTALRRNESFHFSLYRQSGQTRLVGVIESLWVSVGPVLCLLYPHFGSNPDGVVPHNEAIAALRGGDSEEVKRAIRRDITVGRSKVRPLLEAPPETLTPNIIPIKQPSGPGQIQQTENQQGEK